MVGGRNGYGAKLANVFSTEFKVETCDGKSKYCQVFRNNMQMKGTPQITASKEKSFTCILVLLKLFCLVLAFLCFSFSYYSRHHLQTGPLQVRHDQAGRRHRLPLDEACLRHCWIDSGEVFCSPEWGKIGC